MTALPFFCGPRRMLATRGAHVTAAEPTDGMLTYAQDKERAHPQGIEYIQADLAALPDFGGRFDAVVWRTVRPLRYPSGLRATAANLA